MKQLSTPLTNRRKVESILLEVAKVMQDCGIRYEDKFQSYHYQGRIGADVTFVAAYHATGHPSRYSNKACVELRADGERLAKIYTHGGFVTGPKVLGVRGVQDSTALAVVSPNWSRPHGLVTKTQVTAAQDGKTVASQILWVYHHERETAEAAINQIRDRIAASLAKKQTVKKRYCHIQTLDAQRSQSNHNKLEKILLAVEKAAMPRLGNHADEDESRYDFQGTLPSGVTFEGTCQVDLAQGEYQNASVSFQDKQRALGTIVTDGGFVSRLRGLNFHGRVLNEVRGLQPTTTAAVISPRWTEANGRMTITNDVIKSYGRNQKVNQVTVYHALDENADAVVEQINAAAFREKMNLSEKLHHLAQPQNYGHER